MARWGIVIFRGNVRWHELVGGLMSGSASTAWSKRERECRDWSASPDIATTRRSGTRSSRPDIGDTLALLP